METPKREIEVQNYWDTDYGDYRARVFIGENNQPIGEIVVRYEDREIFDLIKSAGFKIPSDICNQFIEKSDNTSNASIKDAIAVLVARDFDNYKKVPRISQCSSQLQRLYDNVCESDNSMAYIENDDETWSEEDIEILRKDVFKYLNDEVEFCDNDEDYRVIAYSNLEVCFIDDRGNNK